MIKPNWKTSFVLVALVALLVACSRPAESPVAAAGPSLSPALTETVPITPPEPPSKGREELEASSAKDAEPTMLAGPNAIPTDTRIIVNIPAFRMDVFANGSLVKSYKVGIGYPQFPLPQGLRKAETIILTRPGLRRTRPGSTQ